jgi:hypothetical protein
MSGRQFLYRYESDPSTDEKELDLLAETDIPEVGQTLMRKGTYWRVAKVDSDSLPPPQLSVYRVFLVPSSKS